MREIHATRGGPGGDPPSPPLAFGCGVPHPGVNPANRTMRAKVRDTELFFDVDGPQFIVDGDRMRERPVLFLLHGVPGGDHSGFKTTSAALRDVAQLVYIDHRGSGRSAQGDPEAYTLDNNVDDVDALHVRGGVDPGCGGEQRSASRAPRRPNPPGGLSRELLAQK